MSGSWLNQVVTAHQYSETPSRYFYWASLAAIAAVTRKRVWLERYYYKLYPNVYVFLVSERSGLKKGPAIALAKNMLNEVQVTRIVTGRGSIQGIIKEFSNQVTLENGNVISDAHGILLADEFAAFLVEDPMAFTILTGLHNTHEHNGMWRNTLKGSPAEVLKNPYINLLAASNESLLDSAIRDKDLLGGFIARTFVIYESEPNCINSLVDPPMGMASAKDLASHLKEISKLEGQFQWTDKAKKVYDSWYRDFRENLKDQDDKTGSLERLGDQILKVAMLISLSNETSLELNHKFIEEAIDKCEECVNYGTKKISRGVGAAPDMSAAVKKLLGIFEKAENHEVPREVLGRKMWPILADVVERIVDTLMKNGGLTQRLDRSVKGYVVYKVTEKAQNEYRAYKASHE